MRRIFLLLEWDSDIGAPVEVVGVLGLEGRDVLAEWIPWHPAQARWYRRVRDGVDGERVAAWLEQDETLAIAEVPEPCSRLDLRAAVAVVLDAHLAPPSVAAGE